MRAHRTGPPQACLPTAGAERCCTIAQPCAASAYSCSSVLSVPAAPVSYAPKPTQGSSDGSTRVPTRGSDSVFIIRSACGGEALLLQLLQHWQHFDEAV